MKYKVIACGVFEPYLEQLSSESEHHIDLKVLDAGLHSRPNDLRLLVQTEIDEASRTGGYDAVILFYGLCGRGTANLVSRDIPVIIPRAHDCITLFLGSAEAYLKQFHKNPGTFYHTLGWIDKKINPKNREAAELYHNYTRDGYRTAPGFQSAQEKVRRRERETHNRFPGALEAALFPRGIYRPRLSRAKRRWSSLQKIWPAFLNGATRL